KDCSKGAEVILLAFHSWQPSRRRLPLGNDGIGTDQVLATHNGLSRIRGNSSHKTSGFCAARGSVRSKLLGASGDFAATCRIAHGFVLRSLSTAQSPALK